MTSLSIRKVPDWCLWGTLLFCTLYESYRYPLKLSFSGTSPTYSNTPLSIQIPKYIITVIICLITIPYIAGKLFPFRKWVLAVLVACMSLYPVFKAVMAEGGDKTAYLVAAFWPLAALTVVLSTNKVTITALDRYFRFVLIFALASTVVEVLLFLIIGRLPALAYANSFSVRFGGFLDDPNAFSAVLYMLMGWAYYRYSGFRRFLVEAALVLCVLLTQSLTAIGFLAMLTLLFVGKHLIHRPRPSLVISIGAVLGIILRLVWSPLVAVISAVLETKSGSVDSHLANITSGQQSSMALGWLFGLPSYTPYESWWIGSVINFGIPWYLLSLIVVATLLLSAFRAFRRARSAHDKAIMSGILFLSCYFVVGSINLPFFAIFPVNFLFFFFSYLVFFEKIKEDGSQIRETSFSRNAALAKSFCVRPESPMH